MQDALYSNLARKNPKKDQVVRMHRHSKVFCQVSSQRIGLRTFRYSKACSFQFVYEGCGPVRIVSRNIVADLIEVGDRART